jgi:hypothetical protein
MTAGKDPSFLLLLDTKQFFQLAKDFQCELHQNKSNTFDLTTNPDVKSNRIISGKVQNASKGTLGSARVTATLYDTLGNNVGSYSQGSVSPSMLTSMQYGVFNLNAT